MTTRVTGSDHTNLWDTIGFTVVDHEDGRVTVTTGGDEADVAEFRTWMAEEAAAGHHPVETLIETWTLGRTGRDGQYRKVTRTSLTFKPATLTYGQVALVPMGPSDANPVATVTEIL